VAIKLLPVMHLASGAVAGLVADLIASQLLHVNFSVICLITFKLAGMNSIFI
jgi:hypothetical protein